MVETQCYATGGYGPCELTVPCDGTLGAALEWRSDTAEIVCGTWAAFKLCTWLAKATGDARYFEWPERLLYNGLGATSPVRPDGLSPYYSDYRLGSATKAPYWEQWPCCSGTYVQAVAHIPDLIYQATEDGLSVSCSSLPGSPRPLASTMWSSNSAPVFPKAMKPSCPCGQTGRSSSRSGSGFPVGRDVLSSS